MIELALDLATAMVGVAALLCVWRLVRGPEIIDRVLALDTMYVTVVALVVLQGVRQGTSLYFEAALVIALLGFVSTAASARYLTRGDVVE